MNKLLLTLICLLLTGYSTGCSGQEQQSKMQDGSGEERYFLPPEAEKHEGTWLNWPHHYTYGKAYRDEIEEIWVEVTGALHKGEAIHIIAYDAAERERIQEVLAASQIDFQAIDFVIAKTDDAWSRDTGPLFVKDSNQKLVIADFAFDGWGEKMPFKHDDKIPQAVAQAKNIPLLAISDFVLEGGSIEHDGAGTLLATKSSVVSKNRNADFTLGQAEEYLKKYLGVCRFIWLEGVTDEDVTDAHIDGIARFYDAKTLLTVSRADFLELYEGIKESDYTILQNATNVKGEKYKMVTLPMTAKNVKGLTYKGSYLNYYIGNRVVIVPTYQDENDAKALEILKKLYVGREIVSIDVTALYQYGGMLHCITQQQPIQ